MYKVTLKTKLLRRKSKKSIYTNIYVKWMQSTYIEHEFCHTCIVNTLLIKHRQWYCIKIYLYM